MNSTKRANASQLSWPMGIGQHAKYRCLLISTGKRCRKAHMGDVHSPLPSCFVPKTSEKSKPSKDVRSHPIRSKAIQNHPLHPPPSNSQRISIHWMHSTGFLSSQLLFGLAWSLDFYHRVHFRTHSFGMTSVSVHSFSSVGKKIRNHNDAIIWAAIKRLDCLLHFCVTKISFFFPSVDMIRCSDFRQFPLNSVPFRVFFYSGWVSQLFV